MSCYNKYFNLQCVYKAKSNIQQQKTVFISFCIALKCCNIELTYSLLFITNKPLLKKYFIWNERSFYFLYQLRSGSMHISGGNKKIVYSCEKFEKKMLLIGL